MSPVFILLNQPPGASCKAAPATPRKWLPIRRQGLLASASALAIVVWFSLLGVSLLAKIPFAKRIYNALPPVPPEGYGDCFVVSAAARGHPGFVGSSFNPVTNSTVNRQLLTLWQFEQHLILHWPLIHRRLRQVYNAIGPAIAKRIRSPYTADAVYLLLKPAQWLAALFLKNVRVLKTRDGE